MVFPRLIKPLVNIAVTCSKLTATHYNSASQNVVTWGACLNAAPDSRDPGWSLGLCIPSELPGEAE